MEIRNNFETSLLETLVSVERMRKNYFCARIQSRISLVSQKQQLTGSLGMTVILVDSELSFTVETMDLINQE